MQKRTATKYIIVHCSATKPSMDIGVEEIRRWHTQERGWEDIGYHFVVRRDGTIENGRDETMIGAHAPGFNQHSIGICLVGGLSEDGKYDEFNFTDIQMYQLKQLITDLRNKYEKQEGKIEVLGHNEVTTAKTCPTFNVPAWLMFDNIVKMSGVR